MRLLEGGRFGNLRAFASVRIGPHLVAHKFRVIEQPGRQRAWVAPPQESWQETGEGPPSGAGASGGTRTRYRALLDMPEAWKRPLADAVLARYEEERRRKAGRS